MSGLPIRLLTLDVRLEHDVIVCRQRARRLATAFGFDRQDQTRIVTAVSEIVRNAFDYAGGGKVEFTVETEQRKAERRRGTEAQHFVITVRDKGPGIPPLEQRHPNGGLGLGLTGARQLMDELEIATKPGATTVVLRKAFPPSAPTLTAPQIQEAVDHIAAEPPSDPLAEVQLQNQELIRAMDEVRAQQDDLARVNRELADTNAGVLALYDELETLHRVGILLAAQLDLKTLLQAITDVTTELTNAQFGAFFNRSETDGAWLLHTVSGPKSAALADLPTTYDTAFFGEGFAEACATFSSEAEGQVKSCCESNFAEALRGKFDLQSCLTIPVANETQTLGAMVFGSTEANAFTERVERIVSSIAAQAVVGIEKARLFERVQSSNAAKDRFLAMLSHELRTPLNPVLAVVSSMVGDERLPTDMQQDLQVVLRNVLLEARLIDDLLDFSRIINGKLQLHQETVDVHTLIQGVVNICADEIAASAHTVTLALEAPHATVFGDPARLQQVLWNVLKNAVKFTPASGRIAIRTAAADDGGLEITVADNGVGIETPALHRIFSAFEQGGLATTVKFGGLGLGLAITKAFVEMQGGTIRARSSGVGQGTQIIIRLPLRQREEEAATPKGAPPAPTPVANAGRLLLVDDHADTLNIISRLLTRRGYQVITAVSCRAALETARQSSFDLIVSDLGLPDGSGLTLLAELRRFSDAPAIALSGYGMEEDVQQSRAAGYHEHLTKPIDFPLLTRTIDRLLTKTSTDAAI